MFCIQVEGFFEGLGEALGRSIRFIVDMLSGVLGAMAGIMGTMQATEILKEILEIGKSLSGRLLIHDGLAGEVRTIRVKPDPACALCGEARSILDLSGHH